MPPSLHIRFLARVCVVLVYAHAVVNNFVDLKSVNHSDTAATNVVAQAMHIIGARPKGIHRVAAFVQLAQVRLPILMTAACEALFACAPELTVTWLPKT